MFKILKKNEPAEQVTAQHYAIRKEIEKLVFSMEGLSRELNACDQETPDGRKRAMKLSRLVGMNDGRAWVLAERLKEEFNDPRPLEYLSHYPR